MSFPRKPPSLAVQLLDLYLIQLTNWRWSWRSTMIVGILSPVVGMTALGIYARATGPASLAYVFTGNLVLCLMFETQSRVANNFAYMKAMGSLDFFSTLPIAREALIFATTGAFITLSLPALVVTILAGVLILGISLQLHPLLLVMVPLISVPMAGFGAWIGLKSRTPESASAISLGVSVLVIAIGPVVIPPELTPEFLRWLGLISPATYASSALQQTLIGPLRSRLWIDAAVLLGFSVLSLRLAVPSLYGRREPS
jgi:ABC-2 type transport system permease protein